MGKIKDEEVGTPVQGDLILASSNATTPPYGTRNLDIDDIDDYFSSRRFLSVPSTSSSSGVAGSIRIDSDYVYICVATNTWKRAAIATW